MTTYRKYKQSGLTLVELMVALLIGSILLAGLMSLFLATRQTQQTRQHLNEIADNARFFTEFIAHDVRMAGYQNADCSISSDDALEWLNSSRTLTIRYCKAGSGDTPVTIRYKFSERSDDTHTVAYTRDKTDTQKLIDGLCLTKIWFGEQKGGKLTYKADTNPGFSKLRTVRLKFTLQSHLEASQKPHTDQRTRSFAVTVAVRNNTLAPLQNSKSEATDNAH